MMAMTPGQCRAARALLGWSQSDLEMRSRVSKKTIADFERGVTAPQARTIDDLAEAFDEAGIEFQPAREGEHGYGLRFRDGFIEPSRAESDPDAPASPKGRRSPLKGCEDMAAYWSGHPAEWAALSQTGRYVLSSDMFGAPEAGDEAFGAS
jgi:transcriptional regulator with XRE-family HTH domain